MNNLSHSACLNHENPRGRLGIAHDFLGPYQCSRIDVAVAVSCATTPGDRSIRLDAFPARGGAGRDLHCPGRDAHRQPATRTRHRRQRLALSGHRRSAVLAAIQPPYPGRAALRNGPPQGGRTGPAVPLRQALLVVQPGRGRGYQRDAQAVLWLRRQQGLWHPGNPAALDRAPGAEARPLPLPHVLGTDGWTRLHAMDRPLAPPKCSAANAPI